MPSSHLILCRPPPLLPTIPPQHQRVFSNESTLRMRWPKYWSFSFSIIPSKEHPGLISFRMDWLDHPGSSRDYQESSPTPQFKSINSSALSFLHSPTLTSIHDHWKTIALTRLTFVDKVLSLLLNMLSRLVITFLPWSKRLLMAAVTICSDFEAQKHKVSHRFHCFPIHLPWSDGTRCHDLSFLNVTVLVTQ